MRFGPVFALGLLGLLSVAARADDYPVSGGTTDGSFSGQGTLTATSVGNGVYKILSMTGKGVDSLLDVNGFYSNDNLLTPGSGAVLDANGFSFTDTDGDTEYEVNIYGKTGGGYAAHVLDYLDAQSAVVNPDLTFTLGSPTTPAASMHAASLRLLSETPTTAVFDFSYGLAAPAATTPEPGSIALLGTGLLGVAGALRRRRS